ncbi:MAG: DsbA family protein, partial [Alphaproteobacteria bacterium]|nr:DsbA family protein [Alphaproteobacteria bacterium]
DVEGALTSMARIAGMPGDKALSCMKDQDTQKHTLAVAQDAATRYGISGVPTFVVNGEVLPSGAPWETVKAKLDSLLAGK